MKTILLACFLSLTLSACSSHSIRPMLEVGSPVPYSKIELLDGNWLTMDSLRGKTVAMLFWASDCNGSRSAITKFNAQAERYKDRSDLMFIAVSVDQDREAFEYYITKNNINSVKHAYSGNGPDDEAYTAFGCGEIPQGFIIDPAGKVVAVDHRADIDQVLK